MAETIWKGVIQGRELIVLRGPDGAGRVTMRVHDNNGLFEVSSVETWADADEAAAIRLAEEFIELHPLSGLAEQRAKQAKFWASVPYVDTVAEYKEYLAGLEPGQLDWVPDDEEDLLSGKSLPRDP